MNCSTFEKKLDDLIENNISYDLKDAMMEHIENCDACRSLYEETLLIEKDFKRAFDGKQVKFTSSRSEIMKNIDRSRYGKSPMKKLIFHLKRNRVSYSACAALLVIGIFTGSYIYQSGLLSGGNKYAQSQAKGQVAPMAQAPIENNTVSSQNDANADSLKAADISKSLPIYVPKFQKETVNKSIEPSFATPWVNSPGGKYSACVDGKGSSAIEEGVGKIFIKDLGTSNKWTLDLINNGSPNANTPMSVSWWDDQYLLATVGYSQGTLAKGGTLVIINVTNGKSAVVQEYATVDNQIDQKQQIISAKRVNNDIQIKVLVYEDDNYMKFHTEDRTVASWDKEMNNLEESLK